MLPRTKHVYLAPGRLYASAEAVQVSTILGSCAAVCLWAPEVGEDVGGERDRKLVFDVQTGSTWSRTIEVER